ncbi:MAG: alpha-1,2-fucosyltransferase [Thermoflexaceae bacterium]|nr:alpha-1,2-fucosyltransferase [Thermoflexaceae bacterium]
MVIVKIGDGLGNQMYNYACGYAAAKKNNDTLRLDISECDNSPIRDYQLEEVFQIDCHDTVSFSNRTFFHKVWKRLWRDLFHHVIYENKNYIFLYDERVYRKKRFRNIYLYGYWQNFQFFDFCRDDIIRQFQCKYEQSEQVQKLILKFQNENTCAIHIRGGDIIGPASEYFKKAIDLMNRINPTVNYVVFTNDAKKASECMKEWDQDMKVEFISNLGVFSDVDEFFMMSACQNQIISNSTFSWWAAYLNTYEKKRIIAPVIPNASSNIYPDGWTVIE